MNSDREVALDYLRTPPGAPWRWEEGGRALVWKDGATIAFREELALIFQRLTPGGLPPFASLVCVLAACRGRYLEFPREAKAATDAQASRLAMQETLARRGQQTAVEQLRKLAALPREVIGHPRGKALLAQIVFEASERTRGADAGRVTNGLSAGLGERELNAEVADAPPLNIASTLHAAAQPLRGFTAETLRLRLATGLDALPVKGPALVLPRGERARRLLTRLEESEEHGGLARVARDLMAAIRLPSVLARADEQASGGAAGLGNRGTLDRLLLSELAHDDLTLATRVALNEALYLHREPPARRPRRGLAVLIDAGLRMWGVPRVLGAATGLALLAGWPDEAEARVWRADGAEAKEVDMLDEAELAAHLAVLGTGLDPGEALPGFGGACAPDGAGRETDAVIVAHRDAVGSAAFRRRLAELEFTRGFLVLIDHDGWVRLHALPLGAARPLAEARTEVDKLFAKAKRAARSVPLVAPELAGDLPAIFRERPFPLLLPVTGKLERTTPYGEGGLCVTADRRLFHWEKMGLGARQLAADLPGGRTCFLEGDTDGTIRVVRGRDGSGKMAVVVFVSDEAEPRVVRVTGPHQPMAVVRDRSVLLLILHTRVAVVAADGSGMISETPIPDGMRPIHGRYFHDGGELLFALWDGSEVRLEKTGFGRHADVSRISLAFDRGGAGPWVLMCDGRILSPAGEKIMTVDVEGVRVDVLRDGQQLLLTAIKGGVRHLADLRLKQTRLLRSDRIAADPAILLPPPTRQLQSRIQAIRLVPGEPLRLRNAKGRWLELFAERDGLRLVMAAKTFALESERRFEAIQTPRALGCGLKRASWAHGSAAWLDDRGLLHLRSANQELPELTIALSMGTPLAVWASDGMLVGPEFFTGGTKVTAPVIVLNLLDRIAQSLC